MEMNNKVQIAENSLAPYQVTSRKSKANTSALIIHARSLYTVLLPPNIGSEMTSVNTSMACIILPNYSK
jgi:hypothetical protein